MSTGLVPWINYARIWRDERRNLDAVVRGLKRRAMHIYWLLLMLIAIGVVVWAVSKRLRGH
jgi:hypothetical protein